MWVAASHIQRPEAIGSGLPLLSFTSSFSEGPHSYWTLDSMTPKQLTGWTRRKLVVRECACAAGGGKGWTNPVSSELSLGPTLHLYLVVMVTALQLAGFRFKGFGSASSESSG